MVDELPALNKAPALMTAATEGRKYGGCLVVGLQDMAQLRTKYSNDEANTMRDGVNLNEKIVKEPIVSPTAVNSLENFECYVRFPEDLPVVKHKMKWKGDGK